MADISDKRVAILVTDGFEQSELMVPKQRLEEAGAKVDVISLKTGEIWGWDHDDWGEPIAVDRSIDAVNIDEYDALVIPGGQINPDLLRINAPALSPCASNMAAARRYCSARASGVFACSASSSIARKAFCASPLAACRRSPRANTCSNATSACRLPAAALRPPISIPSPRMYNPVS